MNKLDREARSKILHLLCEGSSIRAVSRLTGTSKNTIIKLLIDSGKACAAYQDAAFHNLKCERIQVDEIWSFVGAKSANANPEKKFLGKQGDVWTWTAICADTKLMPCWLIGRRDSWTADAFMHDLASRLSHRVQLTSDGYRAYLEAVVDAFQGDIDYAMLVKHYGPAPEGERRYSPPVCTGATRVRIRAHIAGREPHTGVNEMSEVMKQNPYIEYGKNFTTDVLSGKRVQMSQPGLVDRIRDYAFYIQENGKTAGDALLVVDLLDAAKLIDRASRLSEVKQ